MLILCSLILRLFSIEKIYRLHSKSARNHFFERESKIMSTNKKWLFALNLLIFFEKRLANFDKWGKWSLHLIFFPKLGIIPKLWGLWELSQNFIFFFKKIIETLLQSKRNKSLRWVMMDKGAWFVVVIHTTIIGYYNVCHGINPVLNPVFRWLQLI